MYYRDDDHYEDFSGCDNDDRYESAYDDSLPYGICDSCGEYCQATVVDEGIGPYEYWGSKGVHHQYVTCSPCCNAEVVEGETKFLHRKVRTAKKAHRLVNGQTVQPGEKYVEEVHRNHRKGGPSWVVVTKLPYKPS
jgi:hypothetical protein